MNLLIFYLKGEKKMADTVTQMQAEQVKEAVSKRSIDDVKSAMDELNKVWEPIVKKIYPQTENPGQSFTFDPSQFGGMDGTPKNPFTNAN